MALDLEALDRRLGAAAEKLSNGGADAPEAHAQMIRIIEERGLIFRAEHAAKTRLLLNILGEPGPAKELAAELTERFGPDEWAG